MKRVIFYSFLSLVVAANVGAQNKIVIQSDSGKFVINKNIYGHFSEHLGRSIYEGIYVGSKNRTIPNTDGIRNDVVDALRKLKVPLLRWPGAVLPIPIIGRME
ncbi:hypothetical protein LWM68_19735 [Niabella sp. W65]|nr:hypothetical protein [Niabella sp. W65]MCH7364795.1 hypothetical protein [Niabella sp. W65]ULT40634.1 hypothetical protein KRR40_38635 [Niabella sp. I65]